MNEQAVIRIIEAIDALKRFIAPLYATKRSEG